MKRKERDTGYTSYWKHKRPYGKRVANKKNRKAAKNRLTKQQ